MLIALFYGQYTATVSSLEKSNNHERRQQQVLASGYTKRKIQSQCANFSILKICVSRSLSSLSDFTALVMEKLQSIDAQSPSDARLPAHAFQRTPSGARLPAHCCRRTASSLGFWRTASGARLPAHGFRRTLPAHDFRRTASGAWLLAHGFWRTASGARHP